MPQRPKVTNFITKLPTFLCCYQLYYDPTASHAWTPKFTTSLSYGFAEGDQEEALFPNSFKTLQSAHLSNFYQVADPVTVGVEVSYQNREDANGDAADNTRLQLAAQFSF